MRRECVGHRLQAPRHLLQDLNSPSEHTHAIESSSDTGSPPFSLEFGQSRYAGKVVRPPPLVRLLLVPRRRLLPPHTRWLVRASAGWRERARPLAVACGYASRALRHVLLRHHVGMSACHRGWPSCMAVRHALLSHCFWRRCPDTMILTGAPLLLSVSRWCQTKRDTFISSTQTSRKGRTGPIGIHGCVTEMPFSTSPFLVCPTPLASNPAAATPAPSHCRRCCPAATTAAAAPSAPLHRHPYMLALVVHSAVVCARCRCCLRCALACAHVHGRKTGVLGEKQAHVPWCLACIPLEHAMDWALAEVG